MDSAKGKIFNLKKERSKSHHKSLDCEGLRGKNDKWPHSLPQPTIKAEQDIAKSQPCDISVSEQV